MTSLTTGLATSVIYIEMLSNISHFLFTNSKFKILKRTLIFSCEFGKHSVCWKGTIKEVSDSCLSEIYASYKIAAFRRNCSLLH